MLLNIAVIRLKSSIPASTLLSEALQK